MKQKSPNQSIQRMEAGPFSSLSFPESWAAGSHPLMLSVHRLRCIMKAIVPFLLVAACQFCFAAGDTNIIAMSDWSKPVGTFHGHSLRARMIIAQEHSAAHAGQWPETEFYLELQNVSGSIGSPTRIYFDPGRSLRCEVLDANGKEREVRYNAGHWTGE